MWCAGFVFACGVLDCLLFTAGGGLALLLLVLVGLVACWVWFVVSGVRFTLQFGLDLSVVWGGLLGV